MQTAEETETHCSEKHRFKKGASLRGRGNKQNGSITVTGFKPGCNFRGREKKGRKK